MVRLTILGDVDLRAGDGTLIGSVLSQPRRFALLVYLALEAGGGGVQRERLLGVFWPDLPQEKARQSLRTALHFLRRSLGKDAVVGHGDLLALDPDQVACDAAELRAALAADDAEEALRLYDGDLLPGFYLDGGPVEFERWLDDVRNDLRREAAAASWSLAEAREQAGNFAAAGAWARKAAALSPADEAAVRRAIELLGRVGDRAGALATYDELVRRLAEDYDSSPSPRTEEVVASIRQADGPRHAPDAATDGAIDRVHAATAAPSRGNGVAGSGGPGDRASASADGASWEDGQGSNGAAPSPESGGDGSRKRPLRALASSVVTLLLVVAFYSLWGLDRVDPAWTAPLDLRPVIQVETIRDFSPDGAAADLAGALTMELAARLGQIDGIAVVPVTTAGSEPAAGGPTPTYLIRGGLLRSDSTARVTAMLLDAASGATLQRLSAERPLADPAVTVDQLVEILGLEVRREVGKAVADFNRRAVARDARSLQLVRAGLRDMEVADSLRAAGAVEAARLAFVTADSQLARAAEAAPRWPEPSVQRAELALHRLWLHLIPVRDADSLDATIDQGLRHAEAALAIAPDDPAALELAGTLHHWRWLTGAGAEDADGTLRKEAGREAERYFRRATTIDPGLARSWSLLSGIQEANGEFGAANLSAGRAYRADAYLENVHNVLVRLFATSLEIGDYAGAREWCGEIRRRSTNSVLHGYCRLELLAWSPKLARVDTDSVDAIIAGAVPEGPGADQMRSMLEMLGAVVFARAGHRDRALALIDGARGRGGDDLAMSQYEASARLALGQVDLAADLLARSAMKHPFRAARLLQSRRFEDLRTHERITQLGSSMQNRWASGVVPPSK